MPSDNKTLLTCYNKGCGQKYDSESNNDDACCFHPGVPYFHDAYKGWTCCNKKSTDFTEFLNFPGCTTGPHSNVKPEEPVKIKPSETEAAEVIVVKPLMQPVLDRPPFDSPMTILKPILAPSVKQQLNTIQNNTIEVKSENDESIINIGTPCQNSGCKTTYEGPSTDTTSCVYHPGSPIFHEGMKYWSCCQKKTSDFQTFLNQVGCATGTHLWHKKDNKENVECRWDWHQTGNEVVISIYAKEYCPSRSGVKINPIRVTVELIFPKQGDSTFNLDIETRGVIDVQTSKVTMFGTKVEINLRKAQLCKWEKLDIPRKVEPAKKKESAKVEKITPQVEAIDLDDL